MGINSAERERLEKLDNLSLLEHFITLQQQATDLFNKREMCRNNLTQWDYYHQLYYEKTSEFIEVKYIVVARMNKGDLYEDLRKATIGNK